MKRQTFGSLTSRYRSKRGKIIRKKTSIGEYLAFLSVKYDVDSEKFLYALRSVVKHKKTRCDKLSIQFRGKAKNKVIVLIMRESEVIAQFSIVEEFLLNKNNQLRNFMETNRIRRYLDKKAQAAICNLIKDLRTGMNHVNLKAEILEVTEPKQVVTRYGNHAIVAKALIADKTGTIKLCLWNQQIAAVSVGDTIQIENAKISAFRGERHITLEKNGRPLTLKKMEIMPY